MARALLLFLGLFLIGEALALLFGAALRDRDWASYKNLLFLGIDAGSGLILVYFALLGGPRTAPLILACLLGLLLLTQAYREAEFWLDAANAFSFNRPLEIANLLKLVLTGGVLLLADD